MGQVVVAEGAAAASAAAAEAVVVGGTADHADAAAEVAVENAGTAASRWQSRRQVGHYHGSPKSPDHCSC